MSTESLPKTRLQRRRDAGMTLPELLIVITMMGVLSAVIGTAIVTTFRVSRSTEGRVNVARAEQNIDVWLPADLASTDVTDLTLPAVDTSPTATPCGNCGSIDLSGSNALQLAWTTQIAGASAGDAPIEIVTRVQYQYIRVGDEWQIQRIECVGSEPCRMNVVLHDLDGPPDPSAYADVAPTWVFDVAAPDSNPDLSDTARRVVVTINGGGESAGAGGGENTVSLTAGGRTTDEIAADDFIVPSFVRARSRCGGPISLLVDTSGSIPTNDLNNVVEPGVQAFINAFRDTPTQIQVIEFGDHARPMGPGNDWHKYVDMTDEAAVDALVAEVTKLSDRRAGARTNWEDPFFRALKNADGTAALQASNRIVFFTDGVPTVHRRMDPESGKPADQFYTGTQVDYNAGKYDPSKWTAIYNQTAVTKFNQESFDRTDALLDANRGIDLIFVGVGNGLQSVDRKWIQNRQAYTDPSADPAPVVNRAGKDILTELLANAPSGQVPAVQSGGEYTNAEVANYYEQSNFNAANFAAAMRAAALKDCGGTLTLQTRLADGTPVSDEFVYENSEFRDDDGVVIGSEVRRVTTSSTFKTGTFDFEIPSDTEYFDVDIVPQELQTQAGYTPVGWSCRAGADARVPEAVIDVPDSAYDGITVRVRPNEAVSCILEVTT
jgi:prepilin-type N-terminal cleavage/methylation domain-containing protein